MNATNTNKKTNELDTLLILYGKRGERNILPTNTIPAKTSSAEPTTLVRLNSIVAFDKNRPRARDGIT